MSVCITAIKILFRIIIYSKIYQIKGYDIIVAEVATFSADPSDLRDVILEDKVKKDSEGWTDPRGISTDLIVADSSEVYLICKE